MKSRIAVYTLFLLTSVLVMSCGGLSSLEKQEPRLRIEREYRGTTFDTELALRYLTYSKYEEEQGNGSNANHFAKKGNAAVNGEFVDIERASKGEYTSDEQRKEFEFALERLKPILVRVNEDRFPVEIAKLQFLYDCWLDKEVRQGAVYGSSKCKDQFFDQLDKIEELLSKPIVIKKESTIGDMPYTESDKVKKYDVYFDLNSYKLNRNANKAVLDVLSYIDSLDGNYKIMLEAHADRSGNRRYNDVLARKRLLAIKGKLLKNGIPEEMIEETESEGEKAPKIMSKDGMALNRNRSVSIYITKGEEEVSLVPLPIVDKKKK